MLEHRQDICHHDKMLLSSNQRITHIVSSMEGDSHTYQQQIAELQNLHSKEACELKAETEKWYTQYIYHLTSMAH